MKVIQQDNVLGSGAVTVKSTARLHMGFFDLNGGIGRKFGSIGLSLQAPSIELTARRSDTFALQVADSITQETADKARSLIELLASKLNISNLVHVEINQFVASHAGLGSGTQLALVIGAALNKLFDLNLTTTEIAILTNRGGRSGIGIAAFDYGGLLVDGGRKVEGNAAPSVPPLLARYDFPDDWRVLLISDNTAPGVHGEAEKVAFSELPVFPEALAAQLCRHVLMNALPAIAEQDLTAFGQSIQAIQAHTGDYFAPAQGGRYASPIVGEVLNALSDMGAQCFGQSSWGPTGFAVFESEAEANETLEHLKGRFKSRHLSWMVTKACNHGAQVTLESRL